MNPKMLVLLDGSKLAEVVFTYAQELSARLNMNLELLHVCSPEEVEQLPTRQAYMDHMAEMLQKKINEIRSKMGDQTPCLEIRPQSKVVVGYPAEEILKYADENNVDMIILSTHGRSGITAWDIGNVAHKVIHASNVPVWIVPTELREEIIYDKLPNRPMVIPLSGSKLSEAVIPYAINLAKQRGAVSELVLIHVEHPISADSPSNMRRQQAEHLEIKRYLDDVVKRIEKEDLKARAEILTVNLSTSSPAKAILNYIKSNPAQLIAMATHSRVGLSNMVFSSVTENILHLVKKTPIFLVKP